MNVSSCYETVVTSLIMNRQMLFLLTGLCALRSGLAQVHFLSRFNRFMKILEKKFMSECRKVYKIINIKLRKKMKIFINISCIIIIPCLLKI